MKEIVKSEGTRSREYINKEIYQYYDIINLPHHVSKTHPQMSMEARAAQFAPFSALTEYGESIKKFSQY